MGLTKKIKKCYLLSVVVVVPRNLLKIEASYTATDVEKKRIAIIACQHFKDCKHFKS